MSGDGTVAALKRKMKLPTLLKACGADRKESQLKPLARSGEADTAALLPTGSRGKPRMPPLVQIAFFFPAFAGMLFGFDIGATSGAVHQLRQDCGGEGLRDSSTLTGLVTSSSLAGAFIGTAASYVFADIIGRRGELIVAGLLYGLGSVGTVLAPQGECGQVDHVLSWVVAARMVYGLGIAFAMHAAPVYISEMAPSHCRGFLVAAKEGRPHLPRTQPCPRWPTQPGQTAAHTGRP